MKKTFKKVIKVGGMAALLAAGFGIGVASPALIIKAVQSSKAEKGKKEYGDVYEYYMKTSYGAPLKLPIKNNVLPIVLDSFGEEAKTNAKYAISKLDNILDSKEIIIYDNEKNLKDKNYIKVSLVEDLKSETDTTYSGTAGKIHFDFNDITGIMKYPIIIEIDDKYVSEYNTFREKNTPEKSVFSKILQHELGHAFGLCDRYEKTDYDDTIMYYASHSKTQDYTERDIKNLKRIYDSEYHVTIDEPTELNVTYYIPQKEIDMENVL